jgi:predicted ATP-dependent serine protease
VKNILDIKVPERLQTKVTTSNEIIDFAMGDNKITGITPSSVIYFTGVSGCGKSTILRQMCDSSHNCVSLYNCTEESEIQIALKCDSLKLKNGFLVETYEEVQDVIAAANNTINQFPFKQFILVVDSLPYMRINGERDDIEVTKKLKDWVKDTYSILFLVGHTTKAGKFAGKNEIQHLIDAHCHLYLDKKKQRWCDVLKNRFGDTKSFKFDVDSGGVTIHHESEDDELENIDNIFNIEEEKKYKPDEIILKEFNEDISRIFGGI